MQSESPLISKPDCRERLLRSGAEALADHELLAILLGTGMAGESSVRVAALLLERVGGVRGLDKLGAHALSAERGVGNAKAARIRAALELGRRSTLALLSEQRPVVSTLAAVSAWAEPRLALLDHEEVWLLTLDGRNGLRTTQRVAQGGLHGCALSARDVLRVALRDAATAIVLVHNHPSGDPRPSPEDVEMTRALAVAADVVGVPLLDHVIIGRHGTSSLLDLGVLPA